MTNKTEHTKDMNYVPKELRNKLLEKIDGMNVRLQQLKNQGESSNNKTLKNVRYRRNLLIKGLIKLLQPEILYEN